MQVKSNPQLQAILSTPTANGSPLTAQDSQGKIQLTVAGQAKVQEVYNQLTLTKTIGVKHFANAQTVQIVTLVAAIALTVVTGGAAAGTVGADGRPVGAHSKPEETAAVTARDFWMPRKYIS